MRTLLQDLRYGVRMLLKRPSFTFIAVLTLALGIGANTAIFSVINGVLLRPLPFSEADRLVRVYEKRLKLGRVRNSVSAPDFIDWRSQNRVFEDIAAYAPWSTNLTGGDEPQRLSGTVTSASLFSVLGVQPQLGRTFLAEEDQPNGNRVVILSHALWQRRFGADPGIVGKPIVLNGANFTVVGVMPAGFEFPSKETELWSPLGLDTANQEGRGSHFLDVVARLKPGVTLQLAQSNMDAIAGELEKQYQVNTGHGVNIFPLYEEIVGNVRPALLVLLGAVGLVLLIACANVANLLLVRTVSRQKEIAIRATLGASRGRIIQQLLTESVLLGLLGGALGLLLAIWGTDLLINISPSNMPRISEITIDYRVLGFTFAISLLTGVIFGLLPALQALRVNVNDSLKSEGRGVVGSSSRSRARSVLIVTEIALALVLLVGAGLLIKSFKRLGEVDPGFKPDNVLTMQLSLPRSKYSKPEQQSAFLQQVLERIEAVPGVGSVSVVAGPPFSGLTASRYFQIEGRPPRPAGEGLNAGYNAASPNYFQTLGIPLRRGRDFTKQDVMGTPEVVIINEAMARRFWPDEDAVGGRLRIGEDAWRTVVGVVGDVRHTGLDEEPKPEMFYPYLQSPLSFMTLMVRSTTDEKALRASIQREIRAVDPDLPVYGIKSMEQMISESVSPRRLNMILLTTFAVVALVMAALGIYGVMAYSVSQRTHEIGIRMALGAQRGDVLKMIVGQGMILTLMGIGIGLAASFGLTRLMRSLLYGVTATDPLTYIAVALVLGTVALMASLIPARRATRVDPMEALRYE
ncbi:MAG TPA: ABC transporter permease [Pyrinomonadaceae bacterium]|jgi:putative ABC transport system permease protein|nr:ABC transporter permease [Pyrinomonadaceae bacterium]